MLFRTAAVARLRPTSGPHSARSRRGVGLLTATIGVLTILSGGTALAQTGPPPPTSPELGKANELMALPAAAFVVADKTSPGRPFNLRTDGCSGPINPAYFKDACIQHDFAYRNYGKSDGGLGLALTEAARSYADERFRVELNRSCEAWAIPATTAEDCLNQAALAYTAVRSEGSNAFFGR